MTENTPAVTAKRAVPRFAGRVSAGPPSRGDPRPGTLLRQISKVVFASLMAFWIWAIVGVVNGCECRFSKA